MSFRVKITIIITALVALLFSFGSSVMIHRSYMNSITREEQEAVSSIEMISNAVQMAYERGGLRGEESLLQALRRLGSYETSTDVFLLFRDENVIYSSTSRSEYAEYQSGGSTSRVQDAFGKYGIDISKIKNSINGYDDIYVSYKNSYEGMQYIISSTKLSIGDNDYILSVVRDVEVVTTNRQRMHSLFVSTFVILLVIASLVSWAMASLLVRPMSKLYRATREIASGNLSYRSNVKTDDEIGELSRRFDIMASEMEENVNLLEKNAEEKDRFMGAFTHELKTPMTSIIGYAELLRTTELEPEDKEDALNYIYSEAKRLENMSLKLLQIFVADKEKLDLKKVSPKDIVEDVVTHLTPTLSEQDIKIICRTEEGTAYLESDLVKTLLINLIDNARKAMEGKGNIRVDQKFGEGGVVLSITDNGKGMPKEAIEHVTEAFYRVDKARSRQQGGAGLGLALVAKIVELHNGDIDITSEPGVGTVVTVILRGGAADETRG